MKYSIQKLMTAALAVTLVALPTTVNAAGNQTVTGEAANGSAPTVLTNEGAPADGSIGSADITVNAEEKGSASDIVYNVAINWGDMNFSYQYGESWDAEHATYTPSGSGSGWDVTQINNSNCFVEVNNKSNYPVTIGASFKASENRFNEDNTSSPTKVTGVFNANIDTLKNKINTAETLKTNPSANVAPTDAGDTYYKFNLNTPDNKTDVPGKYLQ